MQVLILVVVEDGLVLTIYAIDRIVNYVLILVVVEDGLVPFAHGKRKMLNISSLNPCCSGRWSRTS